MELWIVEFTDRGYVGINHKEVLHLEPHHRIHLLTSLDLIKSTVSAKET